MFKKILSHTLFAFIGVIAGAFAMTLTAYLAPDFGFIIRNAEKDGWSTKDIRTALNESHKRWE